MSTRDRNAGGTADELPRDPLLARVYREQAGAAGGPPPALDAQILAAARAAAAEPRRPVRPALPWWRRLVVPVSVTAVVVVSATLTLMVHEEQEKEAARRGAPAPAAAPAVAPAPEPYSAPASAGPVPQPMPAENAQSVREAVRPETRREQASKRTTTGESTAGDADLAALRRPAVAGSMRGNAAAESATAAPASPPLPQAQGGIADQAPDAARIGAGRAPAPATASAPVGAAASPPATAAPAAPAASMAPAPLPFPASRAPAPTGAAAGEAVERRSASPGAPAADAATAAPLAKPQPGPQGEPAPGVRFKSRANMAGEAERSEKAAAPLQESRQDALRTPEEWIREIRELRRAGRETEWRAALARFRERYPDYGIPADLRN